MSMDLAPDMQGKGSTEVLNWGMAAGGLDILQDDWQVQLESAELGQSGSCAAVCAVPCAGNAVQGNAACGSCVFVCGSMCRAHLWVPMAALASCAAGSGEAEGGSACEEVMMGACVAAVREALEAAGLGHTQVLCMRVYYRTECFQESSLEAALTRAWCRARGSDTAEAPPAAFVPVLAVGPTADADAALLVELVAMASCQVL